MGSQPCGSCARLCVALCGGGGSRPTLALTFISGHVAVFTAPLPFARGSDRGYSSRFNIYASSVSRSGSVCVISSAIGGDNRLVSGDIRGLASGGGRAEESTSHSASGAAFGPCPRVTS